MTPPTQIPATSSSRPGLLILSYSPISRDARVLRQVKLFSERFDVTTLGFGEAVDGVAAHYEITVPTGTRRRMRAYIEAVLLRLHLYRLMYWTDPLVRATRRALRGKYPQRILANDIYTVPLALRLAPAESIHTDLHEYYPGLHDDSAQWRRLRQPYLTWIVETYGARPVSASTVGAEIADAYRRHGIEAQVVANAPAYLPYSPGTVSAPIRLVHAGAALPTRRIETMMRAVAESSADIELSVLLTPNNPAYVAELEQLARSLGPRVRMLPPVDHHDLLPTLNRYDVGIHVLPATVTNQALALPNKFFDFVQARLGIIVGPTPGMARLVEEHGLGAVTAGFEASDIRTVLDAIDAEAVQRWKKAAHAAAAKLSAESQLPVWADAIDGLSAVPR
ncbi:glycosyltransferase family 1 protein [Microbacterium sp.]|uniref:glycosyltransferase family 1 protein n=1 Tax=Microbacterium sp. TaxID=51671 RepID=UPI0028121815|nr:glycosyltransferase family 1 protein [Microbacterium sp.]